MTGVTAAPSSTVLDLGHPLTPLLELKRHEIVECQGTAKPRALGA